MRGRGTNQARSESAAVDQFYRSLACAFYDVKVRDHVSGIVPEESRSGATRYRCDVTIPKVHHGGFGRNEYHGVTRPLKKFDGRLLFGSQITPWSHGPGGRRLLYITGGVRGRQKVRMSDRQHCGQYHCGWPTSKFPPHSVPADYI